MSAWGTVTRCSPSAPSSGASCRTRRFKVGGMRVFALRSGWVDRTIARVQGSSPALAACSLAQTCPAPSTRQRLQQRPRLPVKRQTRKRQQSEPRPQRRSAPGSAAPQLSMGGCAHVLRSSGTATAQGVRSAGSCVSTPESAASISALHLLLCSSLLPPQVLARGTQVPRGLAHQQVVG